MNIQIALCPSEIHRFRLQPLQNVTSVVFDVLRATSSIVTGLAAGVEAFVPMETIEEAIARKKSAPSFLLAGEREGVAPPGFDLGNSPREFLNVAGRCVLMTTTNGTVAIKSVAGSAQVLIGALLNIEALAALLLRRRPEHLLLVCSGTHEDFSLEDAIAAGALVRRLTASEELSDAAKLVRELYERAKNDLEDWLRRTQNGQALSRIGKELDIRDCARSSCYDAVGELRGETIVRVE
jgi:2-phosphosulfolactate phosphatase